MASITTPPRSPPEVNPSEPWVSVDEVAAHLGVRKESIDRWIEARELPAQKVGKLWKLKLSEVDAWVRAQSEQARDEANQTFGRSVLVVDDDPLIRETLSDFLADEGFRALLAPDGEKALGLLQSTAVLPSAIVLDLGMPLLNGVRFREALMRDQRLAAVPVIVVTAEPVRELAGTVFLRKPLQLRALTAALAQVVPEAFARSKAR